MPSRVYVICNSYESGYGHGFNNDGLDLSRTPHGDPECGEAYQIGYTAGQEKFKQMQLPPNITIHFHHDSLNS